MCLATGGGTMIICRSLRDLVTEDMGLCPSGMNFVMLNFSGKECFKNPEAMNSDQ